MAETFTPYRKLSERAREAARLWSAVGLLWWDQRTFLPPKALPFRAGLIADFSGRAHRLFTAKKVGDLISACEQHGFPAGSDEAANLREWRRLYDRATKVPPRLIEKFTRVCSLAEAAWREARERSQFAALKPHLQKVLELNRRMADCYGYQESPYDALLEEYEPGARTSQLRALFGELRPALVAILGPAMERMAAVPEDLLRGHYPVATQQAFNRRVAEAMGFDFGAGRIDTTAHPFCAGLNPGDCRLTTRYDEQYFTRSLYGVMHEAGHGLYEQGLPADHFGTPRGSAASLGIHESQSRLWENHVGRSAAFWEHWHPAACEHFPELKKFSPAQLTAAVNRVAPSFIRVEADQVTYDLHIILRFEIEVKLIEKQLAVADVPACWNEEFEKMFGLKVKRDADGCLQDIHWSSGLLGYFPTYTLGNLNAAQLMRRIALDRPTLQAEMARGEYGVLRDWLREKIHCQGLRHRPAELMQHATGEPTRSSWHLEYLRKKFGAG